MSNAIGATLYAAMGAAWITSIVICMQKAYWGLLLGVVLIPPLGVIHGLASWFGFL